MEDLLENKVGKRINKFIFTASCFTLKSGYDPCLDIFCGLSDFHVLCSQNFEFDYYGTLI